MIKLLFILLFGYQSQDISLMWQTGGNHYRLMERFGHKVKGSNEVWSLSLNGGGFKLSGYQKEHEISKAEFLLWYYLLEDEMKQHEMQREQKILEGYSKTI